MTATDFEASGFLEKVLGIVPGVIYVFNQETQSSEYSNRSIGDLLGYDAAEIIRMGERLMPEICHPEDLPRVAAHFEAIQELKDEEIITLEYRMRHNDGHWVWLLSHDTVFERDDEGRVLRHIGTATDISAQKAAEEAARVNLAAAEKARLDQVRAAQFTTKIMDTATSAIVALRSDNTITAINSAGRHFLGGVTEPVPFSWPTTVKFVDRETLQEIDAPQHPLVRSLGGHPLAGEIYSMTRRNMESVRYVRVSSGPVEGDQLQFSCVLVMDDVSDQEMNRQKVERTSRLDALGQLTGGIAHDFNNLLSTVQYALSLAETAEDKAKRTYLETAKQAVTRGGDLTKRLLAFAKQQPGLATSREVNGIVADIRKLATPLLEASLTVKFQVERDDLWVFCDTAQLGNALLNLLLNARDSILRSGKGSAISILVRPISELDSDVMRRREHPNTFIAQGLHREHAEEQTGGASYRYIEFAVTDDGPGMPDEVKRRAIDPFFTTKEKGSGTGLGLSMVYGFIQQSNGELRIYSEPNQGTTVRMLLPMGTKAGDREEPLPRDVPQPGKGEVILVVEDELSLSIMLQELISSLGYQVDVARTAEDALKLFDRGTGFDLVLTDIVMPGGMDGFELARAIRQRNADIPLLYMSGYTGYSDQDMGDVVAPMLAKPCPPSELASAIRTALGQN